MDTSTPKPARAPASNTGSESNIHQDSVLLIDVPAASEMLSLGKRTVWSLTNRGAIPSYKISRSVRYSPCELRAWIDAGCPTNPGAAKQIRASMRKEARR